MAMSERLKNGEGAAEMTEIEFFDVHGYAAHKEAMTSRALCVGGAGGEADMTHFRGGALSRLDGPPHIMRRRVMNRVLRADGHKWFRDSVLYPTLERNLDELFATAGKDGVARVDLVPFSKRVTLQLAAALIGLRGTDTTEGAEELLRLQQAITLGATDAVVELRFGYTDASVLSGAVEATREYTERFFRPAYEAHRTLLGRVEAGEIAAEDLPYNLMTLMSAHEDPAWEDVGIAVKDSLVILRAGVNSSTQAICRALDELRGWLPEHPEDAERLGDPEFLLSVVNETLRLHPNLPAKLRRATADVVLKSTGETIPEGACAVLWTGQNNRDVTVFGSDADEFNPRRELPPGVFAHGLSFGVGPHRCYGVPIVLGNDGIDGSLVHVLCELLACDVRPDPRAEVDFEGRVLPSVYSSYPVLLTRRAE
jgi:cytochrome P450